MYDPFMAGNWNRCGNSLFYKAGESSIPSDSIPFNAFYVDPVSMILVKVTCAMGCTVTRHKLLDPKPEFVNSRLSDPSTLEIWSLQVAAKAKKKGWQKELLDALDTQPFRRETLLDDIANLLDEYVYRIIRQRIYHPRNAYQVSIALLDCGVPSC